MYCRERKAPRTIDAAIKGIANARTRAMNGARRVAVMGKTPCRNRGAEDNGAEDSARKMAACGYVVTAAPNADSDAEGALSEGSRRYGCSDITFRLEARSPEISQRPAERDAMRRRALCGRGAPSSRRGRLLGSPGAGWEVCVECARNRLIRQRKTPLRHRPARLRLVALRVRRLGNVEKPTRRQT